MKRSLSGHDYEIVPEERGQFCCPFKRVPGDNAIPHAVVGPPESLKDAWDLLYEWYGAALKKLQVI